MSGNPLGERGALAIAEMLRYNTTLEEFNLSQASIGIDGTVAMAEALYQNTTLKKLNLTLNPVGAMAEMLKHNNTLEELDLSTSALFTYQNSTSNSSIKTLVESLVVNQPLRKLLISNKYESFIRSLPLYSALKERIVFGYIRYIWEL